MMEGRLLYSAPVVTVSNSLQAAVCQNDKPTVTIPSRDSLSDGLGL